MTNNEMNLMIAELAAKCNVTQEEAKAALEAGNWNKLTAGQMLENEKLRKAQEIEEVVSNCETATAQTVADEPTVDEQAEKVEQAEEARTTGRVEGAKRTRARKHCCGKGMKNLGEHIRRLVACGNRNCFEIRHGGGILLELPVTALVILLLCSFGFCAVLLLIGLFAGYRYSFNGKELGRESVNTALNKAADAAEHVKKTVAEA